MEEFYRKYRPEKFSDVIGQDSVVNIIKNKWKTKTIPHAILLCGPFGVGKTTIARIIAKCLKCSPYDLIEKNSADYRGIDDIRAIRSTMNNAPIEGDVRVWVLDECHKITSDAANALLKILEDPPSHAYFILATTEPERLLDGIRQRCLVLKLNPISEESLQAIVQQVCSKEKIKLAEPVMEKLLEYAGGSAREALQILDRVHQLESKQEQLEAITKISTTTKVIEIVKLLLNKNTKWNQLTPILKELQGEDAEQIRYITLSYARSVLLGRDNPRAFRIIEAFRDNFYDCKFSGVVAACYEVLCS